MVNRRKLMLSHDGVRIYHSWKGGRALTWWYALAPDHDAEGGGRDFDIRRLPEAYLAGLDLDMARVADAAETLKAYERMLDAHREVLRRAIDARHDFEASVARDHRKGGAWTWLRRLMGR
ncbi:hypothetical protein DDF62_04060 [Caulobacter radicis]|uniref:hypothetical protein n=1 Tax=Caulobacter radicis TaxID=2172650 RepID=UPI000D57A44D|nr:hypothetical protein [Caulobacter radicis]PVM92332.1 hypothetical protein DDF62_04060 [Caulobacter radicis]